MSRFSKTDIQRSRIINKAKSGLNAQNSILFLFAFVVIVIIGYPLLMIIRSSLTIDGVLDFSAYVSVFSSFKTYKALGNTLYVAFGVLLLSGLMGGGLAFLVENTDFYYKKLVRFLVFLEFCIPSYIISVSWIQITRPAADIFIDFSSCSIRVSHTRSVRIRFWPLSLCCRFIYILWCSSA